VLWKYLGGLKPNDRVDVSVLKATCTIANNYTRGSASVDFQAEAQFRLAGSTYMKTLASGRAEHDFPIGFNGAPVGEVCSTFFKSALDAVGQQARDFVDSVRKKDS
jgi:hypothetical protein